VPLKSYVEALTWLESHVDYERVAPNRRDVPTLAPVIDTLAVLADPQDDYPTIHVTGTNGKGRRRLSREHCSGRPACGWHVHQP